MAKNYVNYERIEELSKVDQHVDLQLKVMKLFEEGGELSQAMLRYLKSPNVSASANVADVKALVLEESMDCMNVLVDIVNTMGFSDEECKLMFEKKLDKWESKQTAYNLVKKD
jgi:NTP pyrophosphatase (non-canonical NTP hydrolase)